jgi:hypothetical protein
MPGRGRTFTSMLISRRVPDQKPPPEYSISPETEGVAATRRVHGLGRVDEPRGGVDVVVAEEAGRREREIGGDGVAIAADVLDATRTTSGVEHPEVRLRAEAAPDARNREDPNRMRCGVPSSSPMRREKNASASPVGNSKKLDPSRKNSRFSGNRNGKRVRFIRRSSTSVSAKSVSTVKFALSAGVTL